jgi:hypothetical protein
MKTSFLEKTNFLMKIYILLKYYFNVFNTLKFLKQKQLK